jgi:quercetin dioxygenase-like cupin family protein
MSELQTKNDQRHDDLEQRITVDMTLIEFLASPDEIGSEICLIRDTVPSGVVVPLHSHPDPEVFYALEGTVEAFQSEDNTDRWTTAGVGAVVAIPGNVKHAWRNALSLPATMVIVTTAKMFEFSREITKPFDPDQPAGLPSLETMQELSKTAARYGFWIASPEENAAIGLIFW